MENSVGIDVVLEAFAGFESNQKTTHRLLDKRRLIKPVGGSILVPATPVIPQIVRLQGAPARGRIWNILKIGVFGSDPHTSISNVSVDVYAGTQVDPSSPVFTEVILSNLAVPSVTQFSKEVEWCESGEELFALFYGSGVVAGVQFTVVARVAEFPTEAIEAMRI